MSLHLDIVVTDWSEREQRLAVQLKLINGRIKVTGPGASGFGVRLMSSIPDPVSGELIHPGAHPEQFLRVLGVWIHGTYLSAVGPHEDIDCEVADVAKLAEVKPPGKV